MCVGELWRQESRARDQSFCQGGKEEGGEEGRKREGRKRGSHGRMGAPTGRMWLYTRKVFQ